ncbi:sigma 54-interacting transcriptional regulator, partial [Candidatus Poribacteria bacterium]|nr:sigma 54-interacting transcriptional regulator [Candidatus Poribacteria bacterium]
HMDLQSKLLHVLQEKQFFRIGGEREVKVNCRILTATNKNLERMVEESCFRRDLFYRINVVNIVLPPLRERKDDIPLLVDYFLTRYSEMYNRERAKISPRLTDMFLNYSWPGNVRELENNIKRFVILGNESQLISEFMRKKENGSYASYGDEQEEIVRFQASRPAAKNLRGQNDDTREPDGEDIHLPEQGTLKEVAKIAQRQAERVMIERVLRQTRWNRRKAAKLLDISYKALLYKIKECGLNED